MIRGRHIRYAFDAIMIVALALLAGMFFGTGGGRSDGGGTYTYPGSSMGADNIWDHFGSTYTKWCNNDACNGFVIQATSNSNFQGEVNAQRNDARSALQSGKPVYVYICVEPATTQTELNATIDSLDNAGFIDDLNSYGMPLFIVYDIEDGSVCGNWNTVTVTQAKSRINNFSNWIVSRAYADGLYPSRPIAFASVPGICGPCSSNTTDQLAVWIANQLPGFNRIGVIFPQLFGPNTWPSWGTYWQNIVNVYDSQGGFTSWPNPNYGDPQGLGVCASQSNIDLLANGFVSITGGRYNIHTWYVYREPWCTR